MATWISGSVGISSGSGRVRIETQLAGQNVGGNYSQINWQIYADFFGADAQLDGGFAEWSGAVVYNNGGRVYNYAGNFSNHSVTMATGSFNVGADANGNSGYGMDGHVTFYQTGTPTASGSEGLPRMALAPSFNSLSYNSLKPTTVNLTATFSTYGHGTSGSMEMYYRLQGSGTWLSLGSQGYSGSNVWTPTGLKPGKVYEYLCNGFNNNGDFVQTGTQTFKTTPVSGMVSIIQAMI